MRIVSLLPSTTEIVFAIGAGDELAGVTIECDYPPEARARRVVSRTTMPPGLAPSEIDAYVTARMAAGEDLYALDEEAFRDIKPDLVITQDLCAVCAVATDDVDAAMSQLGCKGNVLTVDPGSLEEVIDSITVIGTPRRPSIKTTWPEIATAEPDIVVIAPCGYRLDGATKLAEEAMKAEGFPQDAEVWAIDADWVVVRPGPRLVDGVEALAAVIHPDVMPQRPELAACLRP